MLSTITRLSVITKENKEAPLAQWRLHSLLKTSAPLQIQDVWKNAEERFLSSSTESYHSWSVLSRSSAGYIMMHDVNIEEAHR